MVLTPQLRQRIEMLQMNSIELNELIQQEILTNPIIEEVQSHEETQEISENIIDHASDGSVSENGGAPDLLLPESSLTTENGLAERNGETPSATDFETTGDYESSENLNREAESSEQDQADWNEEQRPDVFEDIDYGREFQEYLDPGYRTQEVEHKEDAPSFEQFLTRSPSLTEHLEWQLRLQPLKPDLLAAGIGIIGNLNADGRLTADDEEIAEMCEVSIETVEAARGIVLRLDPVGCGARDVRECLLEQLIIKNADSRPAFVMIRDHFTDLQPHRLAHLSKLLDCGLNDLKIELDLIKTLDPYPGRRYAVDEAIYIAPEIYIEKIEGEYVIYFADDGSPRLRLNSTYQSMLGQQKTSKEEREYIKDKMRSAVDLLRNIEHRRQTIYRVVQCIVERQQEFLNQGVQFLKPMMLKDVAEETGMHLSTISRVVNRKYAHTPQGVIELRRFFSEGMLNEDGEEVSTRIVKLRIKKMIEDENQREPITDDQIAKILAKEGIKLSRRTVAKYRDQMQIAGSRERKVLV